MRLPAQVALVLVAMCAVVATAVAQSVYKWTDASGVTHYSEQPPPQAIEAKQLQLNGATPAPEPAPAASTPPSPQSTATALDAAKSDFRKQACATAQSNLKVLSGRGMVLDNGTLEKPAGIEGAKPLSPEQREAITRALQGPVSPVQNPNKTP